jgi:hypothetical protein
MGVLRQGRAQLPENRPQRVQRVVRGTASPNRPRWARPVACYRVAHDRCGDPIVYRRSASARV